MVHNYSNNDKRYWYVLYTKSCHEFKVNRLLKMNQFLTFLPTVEEIRQWCDRKKRIQRPLFQGYIFVNCCMDNRNYYNLLNTQGIVKIIGNPWPYLSKVSDQQIESIKILVENKLPINIFSGLKNGDRIKIKSGVLKGLEGILIRKNEKKFSFVISIATINQSLEINLNCKNVLFEKLV
jgi:transcription termination/antitermination protein NusG